MRNVWAVTRETFLQCVRTRIILVFSVILAVCVLYVGFRIEGDGTLKGRIQTFLAYSTSLTQLLLCLVTIFLTIGVVTGDISRKYIFTVASKPLTRWQYVLGRWSGVMLLTGLLLVMSFGAIYLFARHIRRAQTRVEMAAKPGLVKTETVDPDRLAVEHEVFAARATFQPDPLDIESAFKERMNRLIDETGLDNLIRGQIRHRLQPPPLDSKAPPPPPLDEKKVEKLLHNPALRKQMMEEIAFNLRNQILESRQLVGPGRATTLTYSGLKPEPPDGPPLQIRYKLKPFQSYTSTLKSAWRIINTDPDSGFSQIEFRSDSTQTTSSFMVDPRTITSDGRLTVKYINLLDPKAMATVRIQPEDIVVLQRVGGFEGNFIRAGMLILLRLMFLAAAAVLFGVFLSFPIACLSCMIIFVLSVMSGFIQEATKLPVHSGPPSIFEYFSHYLVVGVNAVLPALEGTATTDSLVDGANIPWKAVLNEYLMAFRPAQADSNVLWRMFGVKIVLGTGLRTFLALGIGWLIFRKRELAGIT